MIQNLRLVILAVASCLIASCSSHSSLSGKKLYVLNANLDVITIAEYELHFTSPDQVTLTQALSCNSFECLTKEKTPMLLQQTIQKAYSYNKGQLQIEGIPNLSSLRFEAGDIIRANTGEQVYTTSITTVTEEERKQRLQDYFKGNEGLAKVFMRLLNNKAPKPLIEKTKDGKIKLN